MIDRLFDDNKDRGKGIDRMGNKTDGLKLKWKFKSRVIDPSVRSRF